jgi:hypothetical protein
MSCFTIQPRRKAIELVLKDWKTVAKYAISSQAVKLLMFRKMSGAGQAYPKAQW